MRLEIVIPDNTRFAVKRKLTSLTKLLSENPELVEELQFDETLDNSEIQGLFSPERLAIADRADADIQAGNGLTLEQLELRLNENRASWLAENQS